MFGREAKEEVTDRRSGERVYSRQTIVWNIKVLARFGRERNELDPALLHRCYQSGKVSHLLHF